MSRLNLGNLEKYRDEILKSEIGALLFNLGKTHIGFNFWRDYFREYSSKFKFSGYKEYVNKDFFRKELMNIDEGLANFLINSEISLKNKKYLLLK